MKKIVLLTVTFLMILTINGTKCHAGFGWLTDLLKPLSETKLSETKIASGLKEALKVAIDNTVKIVGKTNGYLGNNDIRIPVPEKLQIIEGPLRSFGFAEQLDEFTLSMNRAAEKAAPYARDVFIDAIMDMSVSDAQGILNGGNTAATDYFKTKTKQKLVDTYSPIVDKEMDKFDVTQKFKTITGFYDSLPIKQSIQIPNINDYVVGKSLDGLFFIMGQEETNIRTDPKARVTSLLKQVFSKQE
ncbi:MAG: DUF4197 domain-containing protein [Candidatus Ancaeobacter aquaticus]|nr:DUF4197 domain-containing protein [Candidatus Ancaeobacter aquaticus]